MIATLGLEPQVVIIALDELLYQKFNISEVTIIHTAKPGVLSAMEIIKREFAANLYPGIQLRSVVVNDGTDSLRDFHSEKDLQGLMQTLYMEMLRGRKNNSRVHFCLTGGRKVMGILGMVVSQLLFSHKDKAWYLITEDWHPENKNKLHMGENDRAWLLQIPVLRWNEAGTLIQTVAELKDPAEAMEWYERLTRQGRFKRKSEFIKHWLTPAQRKVAYLACLGLNNKDIAYKLKKKVQTVANQLGRIYEKLDEWLEFPDAGANRSVLIAEFAPYFHQVRNREGGNI
ncbi:MAG: CRISPR-associated protein Csx14 [Clostridiales bacterium]|nr:CRISPR-associated protein Csx14 [Clostridiales bacterium]